METKQIILNELPMRTWNHLKMNEAVLEGVKVEGSTEMEIKAEGQLETDQNIPEGFLTIPTGAGRAVDALGEEGDASVTTLKTAKQGEKGRGILQVKAAGQTMNRICLEAAENAEMTVYLDIDSAPEAEGLTVLQTRAELAPHATLRLVQIGHTSQTLDVLNDIGVRCGEGARFELVQLYLGGGRVWSGYEADLLGDDSSCNVYVGYHLQGEQKLDMNYVVRHRGKRSDSVITSAGALSDRSKKIFRGTLDFIKGGKTATGAEKEEVLLMSDEVHNQTIPLILCGEEDVAGSHGATIGKADEDALFYLSSRGIDQERAIAMLAKAKVDGALAYIKDPDLRERTESVIEGIYGHTDEDSES